MEKGTDIFFKGYGSFTNPETNESTKRNTFRNKIFFAREVENNVMKNVTVLDFSKIGYKQILTADEGIFNSEKSEWIFSNGRMITLDKGGNTTSIGFEKYFYPITYKGRTSQCKHP